MYLAGKSFMIATVALLALVHSTTAEADCMTFENPCSEDAHFILDDKTRSASAPYDVSQSDISLGSGWYRSVSNAGGDMPLEPPIIGNCASGAIWLNGALPADEERVEGQGCVRYFKKECVRKYEICIQNCVTFNVYYLRTPDAAADRYCFGSKEPCPEGTSSPTGFKPDCREYSLSVINLAISVDSKEVDKGKYCETEVEFVCDFDQSEDTSELEVKWYADDVLLATVPELQGPARLNTAVLQAQNVKYNVNIKCAVTPKHNDLQGQEVVAEYFAGIVAKKLEFTVDKGEEVTYEAEFTVPYTCPEVCKKKCPMNIAVYIPYDQDGNLNYDNCLNDFVVGRQREVDANNEIPCLQRVEFEKDNDVWPVFQLRLFAHADGLYKQDRSYLLDLRVEGEDEESPWHQYMLPQPQIFLKKSVKSDIEGRICSFNNDPHVTTFDRKKYEMQLEGVFVIYRHKSLPIEVQAFFKAEYNAGRDYHYSSVCGVAIRSGGDLLVADYCNSQITQIRMYECDSLSLKIIKESPSEHHIELPTGATVISRKYYVQIQASALDYDETEGLCGSANLNAGDDFIIKGTDNYDPGMQKQFGLWHYDNFAESWRVDLSESFFVTKVADNQDFGNIQYCSCQLVNEKEGHDIRCGFTQGGKNYCVQSGTDETNKYTSRCFENKKRKRREVVYSDDVDDEPELVYEYNPDAIQVTPEWTNGWTEELATEHCESYFMTRQTVTICEDNTRLDVEGTIVECITDILITGTSSFTSAHLDTFVSSCVTDLQRNVTLFQVSNDTEESLGSQLLAELCPGDCHDNGDCDNGTCFCHEPFGGHDCSVNRNHVPELYGLPFDGVCDQLYRPCRSTPAYADLFIESANLTCKAQVFDMEGNEILDDLKLHLAEVEHSQKVFCQIPESVLPYKVKLSISNNAVSYSDPEDMLIYNSLCWDCSYDNGCSKQVSSCVIDGGCYGEGQLNPDNDQQFCDPDSDEYSWSTSRVNNDPNPDKTSGAQKTAALILPLVLEVLVMFVNNIL